MACFRILSFSLVYFLFFSFFRPPPSSSCDITRPSNHHPYMRSIHNFTIKEANNYTNLYSQTTRGDLSKINISTSSIEKKNSLIKTHFVVSNTNISQSTEIHIGHRKFNNKKSLDQIISLLFLLFFRTQIERLTITIMNMNSHVYIDLT